jgi:hypothetical protein
MLKHLSVPRTVLYSGSNAVATAMKHHCYNLHQVQTEAGDRDKQLRIMTDQNAELLRLLEQEEAQSTRYSADAASASRELETLRSRYGSLLTTAKAHEDAAGRAAREGQLRSEEVRLLRAEAEALRVGGGELRLKAQVTV